MKKTMITLILTAFYVLVSGQSEIKTGIIYGLNHAFSLSAPEGWVLDNASGRSQGLHAVFYRVGGTWQNAETVMYANTAPLQNEMHPTLDDLIAYDINNFKNNYGDIVITEQKDIVINTNVVAKVKYFNGKSYGNFESIAFIDAGKTAVMVIMTSRTEMGFNESLKAFEELVKSYIWLGEKVDVLINEKK